MKLLLIAVMMISASVSYAQFNTQVMETETINVDGYVPERQNTDGELENVKREIEKQKKEVVLNKEKAKSYAVLSKSVEKLSETTEEYIEEKKAAQAEIAAYNLKVKCMQSDSPGPECDKIVRRR